MALSHNRKEKIMLLFNRKLSIGVTLLAIFALSAPSVFAQPVPGGTLDPTTIPKYVQPLVIPPVMNNTGEDHQRLRHCGATVPAADPAGRALERRLTGMPG